MSWLLFGIAALSSVKLRLSEYVETVKSMRKIDITYRSKSVHLFQVLALFGHLLPTNNGFTNRERRGGRGENF